MTGQGCSQSPEAEALFPGLHSQPSASPCHGRIGFLLWLGYALSQVIMPQGLAQPSEPRE